MKKTNAYELMGSQKIDAYKLMDFQKTREYEVTGAQKKIDAYKLMDSQKIDEYEMTGAQKKTDAYKLMDSQKACGLRGAPCGLCAVSVCLSVCVSFFADGALREVSTHWAFPARLP